MNKYKIVYEVTKQYDCIVDAETEEDASFKVEYASDRNVISVKKLDVLDENNEGGVKK